MRTGSASTNGEPLAESSRTAGAKRKIKDEQAVAASSGSGTKRARVATQKKAVTIDLTQDESDLDRKPIMTKIKKEPITPKNRSGNRGVHSPALTANTATTGSSSSIKPSPPNAVVRSLPRRAPSYILSETPRRMQYQIFQGDFNEPELDFLIDPEAELNECYAMAGKLPPTPSYSWRRPTVRLGRLGLLNGRYSLESPLASRKWPDQTSDFSLVFTMDGSALWGRFNLGGVRGIFHIPERPKYSSYQAFDFRWRGESSERDTFRPRKDGGEEKRGRVMAGDNHQGHVKFLGNGRIEGMFSFLSLSFSGLRLDGQGTRSEISAWEMNAEWNKFSSKE